MKYRLGSLTVEAIDTYVRVTIDNCGGIEGNKRYALTKKQCPDSSDVAHMLRGMRGYEPTPAELQACGRAADDARNNTIGFEL